MVLQVLSLPRSALRCLSAIRQSLATRNLLSTIPFFLVLLGLGLRCYLFLSQPVVWHDEGATIANVLGKSYGELLGPLALFQAAPPLFLWIERSLALLLADDLLVLRLVPFLASCLALVLMVPVAHRLLPEKAVPWALFFFACSEMLAWHSCEAKPYATDVLAAILILFIWCSPRGIVRKVLCYILVAPLLMSLSYPVCFLFGGVIVALLCAACKEGRFANYLAITALALVVAGCFGALLFGPIRAQSGPHLVEYWRSFFPELHRPWSIPGWAVGSTLDLFRYDCKPIGQVLSLPALLGLIYLWRRGDQPLVLLLAVPLFLPLAAACFQAYPFGGSRLMVYALPGLVLLSAAGIPPLLSWVRARSKLAALMLVLLFLTPVLGLIRVQWFELGRSDAPAAWEHVRARVGPDDAVIGNNWEHLYCFRTLGPAFTMVGQEIDTHGVSLIPTQDGNGYCLQENNAALHASRLWLVWDDGFPIDWQQALKQLQSKGWTGARVASFRKVDVVLLERNPLVVTWKNRYFAQGIVEPRQLHPAFFGVLTLI